MSTITGAVAGSDGVVPIYQPNARWSQWRLSEVYMGQQGADRYVPNVGDWVVDTDTIEYYTVEALDPTTLVPTLVQIQGAIPDAQFSDDELLVGVGPGPDSETYRCFIDKSTIPYTLTVDERLTIKGSASKTAMIFKGSLLDGTAKVISGFYDQTGTLLGQSLPLELVKESNVTNYTEKTVPVCATTENLLDGEVVTVVAYSDIAKVTSKRQLLVENTQFIRSPELGVKYVTSISLKSPFLSAADPTLIQYPLNVPLRGLNLIGVVNYSDGSKLEMPVDGTKFSVFGWNTGFVATVIGQKIPLVLKYALSDGEVAYGVSVAADRFISRAFTAITVKADGQYTVKLFGYPVWIDAVNGYRLEWYLYNLDRATYYLATPFVKINPNTRAFDPLAYDINQRLNVAINLQDLNGAYKNFIHNQTIDIALMSQGTERDTNWTVGFSPGQSPRFGVGNFAATTFVNQNLSYVKIDCGETVFANWLQRLYWLTQPLSDPSQEAAAPQPNFFSLVVGGVDVEFPIVNWQNQMTVNHLIPDSSTLFVKFFLRTNDNDLQLAVAALPVYQQN